MFIVDDPMLALIARFVLDVQHIDVSDEQFLQEQLRSIERYVDGFPADQRQERALEWIEEHAQRYRVAWQRRVVADQLADRRCRDCPLVREDSGSRCEIHAKWSSLLDEYLHDRISSRKYVEDALGLLKDHKSRLAARRLSSPLRP
ncbi:MAG: hypothetical protein HS104_19170 [Polyangiaceae bacterium]|nr:hypothetical protein [Polyangiaceae bacterium]MCL4752479.1 hypothetical protein [Myxococcales bacterium]